jgi:hypothetical protein
MTSLMLVLLAVTAAEATPQVEVRSLAGQQAVGRLQTLGPERVVVQTADGPVEFPASDLMSLKPVQPPEAAEAGPVLVELADGSRLSVNDVAIDGKQVKLLRPGGDLQTLIEQVNSIRFVPASAEFDTVWSAAVADPAAADRLVLKKKDGFDFLPGVVRDMNALALQFDVSGVRPVKRERVAGLVFYRAKGQEPPKAAGLVKDRSGSTWAATRLELQGDRLRLEVAGQPHELPWSDVQSIDFSAGKILHLGSPETKEWAPFLGAAADLGALAALYEPRVDTSFDGGALLLGGKEYRQGLALHSRSRVTYRLADGARRFQATAGIDDRHSPRGNVRLQIRADARLLFDEPIRGGEQPKPLDLDVSGARRLEILVDYGEGGDLSDHLNLCEARVTQ